MMSCTQLIFSESSNVSVAVGDHAHTLLAASEAGGQLPPPADLHYHRVRDQPED